MTYFFFLLLIIWRVGLFVVSYFGTSWIPFNPRFPYSDIYFINSGLPFFLWSFANFDGVHYLTIIKQGYSAQFTQVFFPLYPVIVRILAGFFHWINPILLGLFLSNIFFVIAVFIFQKLLRLDYKVNIIKWSIIFLIFFPTSFFYGSFYTESLFMLFVFLSFYFARKKKWWLAGIVGGLASSTRLVGIFLLPALLWEQRTEKTKNKIVTSPLLYLVPLGLIAYMVYLQINFGDWLYFWHVQPVFGASRTGQGIIIPPQVIFRYLKIFVSTSYFTESFWIALSEFSFTLFAVICLILAHKKNVRASYLIFSWLALVVPTLTGTFSSMPRYVLVAFPIYIILGMIKSRLAKNLILVTSLLLLIILTVMFTSGHWVA